MTFPCWAEPSFRPSHWLAASPLQQAITPARLCPVCHLLTEQTLASAGRWNQNLSWKRLNGTDSRAVLVCVYVFKKQINILLISSVHALSIHVTTLVGTSIHLSDFLTDMTQVCTFPFSYSEYIAHDY